MCAHVSLNRGTELDNKLSMLVVTGSLSASAVGAFPCKRTQGKVTKPSAVSGVTGVTTPALEVYCDI